MIPRIRIANTTRIVRPSFEEHDKGHPREEDEEDEDAEEDRRARIEIHQPYPSFGRSSRLAVKSFTASMPNAKPPTWAT